VTVKLAQEVLPVQVWQLSHQTSDVNLVMCVKDQRKLLLHQIKLKVVLCAVQESTVPTDHRPLSLVIKEATAKIMPKISLQEDVKVVTTALLMSKSLSKTGRDAQLVITVQKDQRHQFNAQLELSVKVKEPLI
jgi:hypothetical protein